MTVEGKASTAFKRWYESLPLYSGFPAKGTVAGALVVLERLKSDFDLDINTHTAKGGSQVRGAGGSAVRRILESFGESRRFVSEGGRTNRGLRGGINEMLDAIKSAKLERLPAKRRNDLLKSLQGFLVDRVGEFHSQRRLEMLYEPAKSTWQAINDLLRKAAAVGKNGPIAQYLVGAKLQLRFPDFQISNESYSTADIQLGRQGDFYVGDTVFHITVAPTLALYDKCKTNLEQGLKVYLLVPHSLTGWTKENAELQAAGKISVESIESFVSQNIDELSKFSRSEVAKQILELLHIYNKRVDAVEANKSMMIDIPVNLQKLSK